MPNQSALVVIALGLSVAACGKGDSGGPAPSSTSAPAGTSTGAAAAKPAATPAPAKAAFVQKGIPAGKVIVGYIQDAADPSQCSAVTDVPTKKDSFTKDADKLAQMVKGKVVPSCPTDNVVGTCNAGFGMLVNYSGPKWTADTAKKDCAGHPMTKWVD